ncbi:damage-control phosphatase ARMT1 family protein [Methanobrevibacter filiformis]|uniref:Damage-control phosphatase ARMT1-like metal-binding domain-containing protein n=1 Tax=Methanobrevibacter filiformis TaxID=55758 RepID=A0A166E2J4_9EURY|nr:ARMT1-like domain-containing protein [Methanobrevibacter filiformis]KZX16209.1 hypothetical protein MBFIL_05390 [Methanobrevibacter filiformis]
MKVYYECGACFLRQAREAINLSTENNDLKIEITKSIFKYMAENYEKGAQSNKIGTEMHRLIKEKTGCYDPYKKEKILGNEIAVKLLPKVKEILKKDNSLENYVKIAIVGNILDFGGLGLETNLEEIMLENLEKNLTINDNAEFEKAIENVDSVLYLADNTGEIVFDKLFIEKLKNDYGVNVTVALKEKPILNDALVEDGLSIGLDNISTLVSTGTDSVGIVYDDISEEFKEIFKNHEFIITKGHGNYEGITEIPKEVLKDKDIFTLLAVKCPALSQDIGVKERDMVFSKLKV